MTAADPEFLAHLKALILEATDKTEPVGGLQADDILFGPDSSLQLDSLDALQIAMAVQKRYGVRMADSKQVRRALASLSTLADYLTERMS